MKKLGLSGVLMMLIFAAGFAGSPGFYDLKTKTIDGKEFDFSTLKGKKVMIVNTASLCGFTPQYKDLESLYEKYKDKLVIIGFPSNDFGSQEPGSPEEIKKFCTENYNVTFPLMEKVDVKGENISPIYKWLTSKGLNGVMDSEVKWNFQKYLIDENGKLVGVEYSKEKPDSDRTLAWLSAK